MTASLIVVRLEGVLALTGEAFRRAMNRALAEAGFAHTVEAQTFAQVFGNEVTKSGFIDYATRRLYPRKQTDDLRTLFEVTYKHLRQCSEEELTVHTPAPGRGVLDLITAAREQNIALVLLTSLSLPIAQKIAHAVTGEDPARVFAGIVRIDPKNPLVALRQATGFSDGLPIVLETTAQGLAAAQAAGVPSIAVMGPCDLEGGIHGARAVVDGLPELPEDQPPGDAAPDGQSILAALNALVASDLPWQGKPTGLRVQVIDVLEDKGGAVKSVNPTDTIAFLARKLHRENVGALVVISDTGALDGIVSERDLMRGLAEHGTALLDKPVSSIMTRAVITCAPADSLHTVAQVMTKRRIRHLPVSHGGKLIGLISIGDVLRRRLQEVSEQANVLRSSAARPS